MHCHTIVHASTGMQLQLREQSSAFIDELNKRPEKGKHATADIFFNNVYVSTQGSYLERKSKCL